MKPVARIWGVAGLFFLKLPMLLKQLMLLTVLMLLMLLGPAGCSDHGDPAEMEFPPVGGDPVSFADDIQLIFNMNCTGCHGAGGNAGLDLRAGLSYGNLVGVGAVNSTGDLVTMGNPGISVLYQRLTAAVNGPMPPTGVLPEDLQQKVFQWINEGAQNN